MERTSLAPIAAAARAGELERTPEQLQALAALDARARDYADAALSPATRKAYATDWRDFLAFCEQVGSISLPASPDTVAAFLIARADGGLTVSALNRRLSAVRYVHRLRELAQPAGGRLDVVWAGIRNTKGRPARPKRALVARDLKKLLGALPDTLDGQRDRALLLIQFAGALRRSELVALELDGPAAGAARIAFVPEGLEIRLDRSKGDQAGRGAVVAIPVAKGLCAVAALRVWLAAAAIRTGPVFRPIDRHGRLLSGAITGQAVALIVKRAAARAGLSPEVFSGHSARRGFITDAIRGGAAADVVRRHARHAKFETTAGYVAEAERFGQENAVRKVLK